ncbi:casein kinase 1-like protein [Encephalitozoon romaleae SJ-2008]|uniref:non-specific serine/threonine protein kinase n=1 Tax=Encephalitozoon romaleae (strain SJ-2008) TaxID=1178016 RepID=I7ADQ1_ENCRO|nr:casein kinase 1-like protein [Encephalitozoon romaleae SJ-2008]AFN82700.1 casein kinase 1-like protein [Encephalitozoon romaleae SJ-2008]
MTTEIRNIKLVQKIASGAFGDIFIGQNTTTNQTVAVKLEKKAHYSQLKHEYGVYKALGGTRTPKIYEYGKILYENVYVNGLVMELMGKSLEQLFVTCNRRFSLKTVLMLGEKMVDNVEYLHHRNYVHRDIKPDNFVFDLRGDKLYLIDYGLAKEFRNPMTFKHREMRTDKSLTGTARYASLRTHQGYEQSRRDDLESIGFCMVYFLKGRLPWQGLKAKTKQEKYDRIRENKEGISLYELCMGLPKEIHSFCFYARNLGYEDMPNYAYLRTLLNDALRQRGLRNDGVFDWIARTPSDSLGDLEVL